MRKALIKLLTFLALDCHRCCRLASEDFEKPHSRWMRFRIWLHFKLCHVCEVYARQLRFLHESLSRDSEEFRTSDCLNAEARERMRAAIRNDSA